MEEAMLQLIELAQEAAPALWAIGRRQAVTLGIRNAFWAISLGGVVVMCILTFKHGWRMFYDEHKEDAGGWTMVLSGFFGVVFSIITAGCVDSAASYLLNPDYYALKVLLELVSGGN